MKGLHSYTSQCIACPYVVYCVRMAYYIRLKHCYNCNKIDIECDMHVAVSGLARGGAPGLGYFYQNLTLVNRPNCHKNFGHV